MEEILKKLPLSEKLAFLACLVNLVKEDDRIDEEEMDHIADIATASDFPEEMYEHLFADVSMSDLCAIVKDISDPQTKRLLLREMLFIAYSDNEVSDSELMYISEIALAMDLSMEEIEQIGEWVLVYQDAERSGDDLFGRGV